MRKAGLAFAFLAFHDGCIIHIRVNLAVSTPSPGAPTKILQSLQVRTQEEGVVGLKDLGYCPSLHLMMLHHGSTATLRAGDGTHVALASHLSVDMPCKTFVTNCTCAMPARVGGQLASIFHSDLIFKTADRASPIFNRRRLCLPLLVLVLIVLFLVRIFFIFLVLIENRQAVAGKATNTSLILGDHVDLNASFQVICVGRHYLCSGIHK
mmetsp:Transcript_85298/g.138312  ORF Transcript_85298/g.138312 Transcript_85298/m.138312 type:complete len:209 (-) Transcript_85298:326-952(-)